MSGLVNVNVWGKNQSIKKLIWHEKLHRHPNLEKACGLDENHVIVDKDEWEEAKKKMNEIILPQKYLGTPITGISSRGKTQIFMGFDPVLKSKSVKYIEDFKQKMLGHNLRLESLEDKTKDHLASMKAQIMANAIKSRTRSQKKKI